MNCEMKILGMRLFAVTRFFFKVISLHKMKEIWSSLKLMSYMQLQLEMKQKKITKPRITLSNVVILYKFDD